MIAAVDTVSEVAALFTTISGARAVGIAPFTPGRHELQLLAPLHPEPLDSATITVIDAPPPTDVEVAPLPTCLNPLQPEWQYIEIPEYGLPPPPAIR